jgi:hypothetical protein
MQADLAVVRLLQRLLQHSTNVAEQHHTKRWTEVFTILICAEMLHAMRLSEANSKHAS